MTLSRVSGTLLVSPSKMSGASVGPNVWGSVIASRSPLWYHPSESNRETETGPRRGESRALRSSSLFPHGGDDRDRGVELWVSNSGIVGLHGRIMLCML